MRSLPHGHVVAVLGTLRTLGLDTLLAARRRRERELVIAMIVARILTPGSKLATARAVAAETAQTSLGELLDVEDADEDQLYAAMDWLLARQARIETTLASRHLDNTLVLYDVTSSYFEGRTCPLARRGYSRDNRRGTLQIVIGLLCNRAGCPVAVEVFPGNTADPATVAPQVKKLRARFGLERVVLVGDRGMLTDARIREELEPVEGLSWISALRAPAIQRLAAQETIQRSLFDDVDLAEVTSPDFPGERLVVCRNPLLAAERARKRQALLAATETELEKIVRATQRTRQRLHGADKIGLRVGTVRNKYKVGKHFALTITDDAFSYARKQEQITKEAALDGLYVVRTDVDAAQLSTEEVVRAYKSLSVVERAFRTMKTIDLQVRGPSTIAARIGCAHTSSSACWPTTWSGTCAAPWRRCSSRTTTEPPPSAPRSCARPSAPRRPTARPPPSAPRMTSPPRASAASWANSAPSSRTGCGPPRPQARPSRWSRPPTGTSGGRSSCSGSRSDRSHERDRPKCAQVELRHGFTCARLRELPPSSRE